jgi:hypothetical protein
LQGAWAKLERAVELAENLSREFEHVLGGDSGPPIEILRTLDKSGDDEGEMVFTVNRVKTPPIGVGVRLGEVVHNLRTALDQVAWQLARLSLGGASPSRGNFFPICATRADFESRNTQAKLRDTAPRFRRVIESFQPFAGKDNEVLLYLSRLSNRDKHQVLPVVVVAADNPRMTVTPVRDARPRHDQPWTFELFARYPITVGEEALRVPVFIEGPDPTIDLDFEGLFFIGLPDGSNILEVLEAASDRIKVILNRCERLFLTSSGRSLGTGQEDETRRPPLPQEVIITAVGEDGVVLARTSGGLTTLARPG